jgi:hypothetical protein
MPKKNGQKYEGGGIAGYALFRPAVLGASTCARLRFTEPPNYAAALLFGHPALNSNKQK